MEEGEAWQTTIKEGEMKDIVIPDKSDRRYIISGGVMAEQGTDGKQQAPYILKNAAKRIFAGESTTNRIKVHGQKWGWRHTLTEDRNGEISIGCRTFDRLASCVIRGWAFE